MTTRPAAHWAADLCHPLPLLAVATLLINDHVLKGAGLVPASVTGKLSDVAGLLFFPILLATFLRGMCGLTGARVGERALIAGSVVATAAGFALIKLSSSANHLAGSVWGANVMDATDLYALPVTAVAWLLMVERAGCQAERARERLGWHHATVIAVAAFASAATPAPRYPRNFPTWRVVSGTPHRAGCVDMHAAVVKSGKTGVGLHVAMRRVDAAPCTATITEAKLVVRGTAGPREPSGGLILHGSPPPGSHIETTHAATLPPAPHFAGDQATTTVYLPFAFDNNTAWNRGHRSGSFLISTTVNGTTDTWELPALHELTSYHATRERRRAPPSPVWRAR